MKRERPAGTSPKALQRLRREVRALCRVPTGADPDLAASLRAHKAAIEAEIEAHGVPSQATWVRWIKALQNLKRGGQHPSETASYQRAYRASRKTQGKPNGEWERRVAQSHAQIEALSLNRRPEKAGDSAPAIVLGADGLDDSAMEPEPIQVEPEPDTPPRPDPEDVKRLALLDEAIERTQLEIQRTPWRVTRDRLEDELAKMQARRMLLDGTYSRGERRESTEPIRVVSEADPLRRYSAEPPDPGFVSRAEWRRSGRGQSGV